MTGLEKMKSQILDEAGKAADVKVAEAKAQAEELIQAARTEAAREAESISRKSEAEVANYKERAASSMDLQKRSRILEAKQAVIAEVLDRDCSSAKKRRSNNSNQSNKADLSHTDSSSFSSKVKGASSSNLAVLGSGFFLIMLFAIPVKAPSVILLKNIRVALPSLSSSRMKRDIVSASTVRLNIEAFDEAMDS